MRAPDRPLHLAFLGCGRIAAKHRRTLAAVSPLVRCSFASRDASRASEYQRRYAGSTSWGSYAAAIEDPSVDLVMITTPTSSHLELALAALEAGKDVIVEKPAFLRSEDVTTVEWAAATVGRCVFVAENYCYKPLAGALRQLVESGELGEIRFVSVNALTRQEPGGWRNDLSTAGGGALFEGGIHWIDLVAHLGLTVQSVEGFRPGGGDGIERSIVVVLRYLEGAIGTLHHSWETPGRLRGLQLSRIAGTRGSATFESNGLFIQVHTPKRTRWIFPGFADISGYHAMFADFLGAIDRGRDGGMTLARARRDLELVEEALDTSSQRHDRAQPFDLEVMP
ncbi:MAG: Gfo/Idh/MocA family oxidoreductase [Gemmatimonadota bacterium]